ncbi:hypothetical protein [Maribacter sp. 2308TA10-17]|uniref:hypothetical protein n=1 Tax=Maribacter sp. 2308TA10-17 TaxID=3386276 RepID=UPI0039BD6B9B
MRITFLLFMFVFGLISCKEAVQKEVTLVNEMISPAEIKSSLPFLFSNEEKLLMSWAEKENDSVTRVHYSEFMKGEWQPAQNILQGNDWFVNWADFPAIAENNGSLISHVLKKSSAGTYSYDVKLNLLPEGEKQWKTNLPLHTDNTPTEHGFVSVLPYKKSFFITWLDGRNTEEDENGNSGAMTLRAAEVSVTGEIQNETELDARICDCCQTTAAMTANGPVVMYRDRSEDEVRDMSIVRLENGNWTTPKIVFADNWEIKGCPVNGPKASAIGNTLAMAWFTGANAEPKVKVIFSTDGGANFENAIVVSEKNTMGRVDIVLVDEQTAIVSWMESFQGMAQFKAMRVHRDGSKGEELIITEMDASRKSGFPQMEKHDDKIYFAWTDYGSDQNAVKTAFVLVDRF